MASEGVDSDHSYEALRDKYDRFRKEFGIHAVTAVSGGAQTRIPGVPDVIVNAYRSNLEDRVRNVVEDALSQFRGFAVAIMTGGTDEGVPRIATEIAKRLGLNAVFIYPLRGKPHRINGIDPDLELIVPPAIGDSQWGDESPLFAQLLDGMLVLGGNTGTLIECAHVFKINESTIKQGKVKYVVPVRGFGGVSEIIHFLCPRDEVRSRCLPAEVVYNGREAGKLLLDNTSAGESYRV